eukprot:CAMPEP_0113698194 /NCGR_PEP_ID=MMETSP0038_2-20120614/22569_1 /TAXON_ID=2898 /ORGANISM="Cryptomonas paramecium" /LENGTH=188 /DNA_ID=CAMNT_0000621319 /DNA_START=294 /DNA_END=857 /DNA_ORIENTATION=+ /assembly_acc=CAM_ASM_000170
MTLTVFRLKDGGRGMSTHGLLERSGHFGPEYLQKTQALFDKYYPIEVDPHLSPDKKLAAMEEWWEASHALIVAQGVRRQDLDTCAGNGGLAFREGVRQLLEATRARRIPVLIFSAGLGDVLRQALRLHLGEWDHVRVFANWMQFNQSDVVTGFKGRTMHVLNKASFAQQAAQGQAGEAPRRNVLLMGD